MKHTTMWVIFAGPQQLKGPGTRYVATDGTVTTNKRYAAKFSIRGDATDFAKANKVELNDVTRYIGQEDFIDSDI